MECIFYKSLLKSESIIEIEGQEARHIRALRVREGDALTVVNGQGLAAVSIVEQISKNGYKLKILEFKENFGENENRLGLALGILDDRERFEFALEKAIELGITDFYPIISKFVQKKGINAERLEAKSIAAIKQCCRSRLPEIHEPVSFTEIFKISKQFDNVILADIDGGSPDKLNGSSLFIVGPEGGFSADEINLAKSNDVMLWKLGIRRLRAETAAIAVLSVGIGYRE
jgi:16S rRNA (uracil1498-N3)-methyltransferase